MIVTLTDCVIEAEPMTRDFCMVVFSLPGMMDLHGIKNRIDNYQCGHERFTNKFGTLYVACDFVVRYWPAEKKLLAHRNGFEFESRWDWPDFKGNRFQIDVHSNAVRIERNDEPSQIIAKIEQHKNLRPYLDSFFNWLNASIQQYGEKFYTPLETS